MSHNTTSQVVVSALYHFVALENFKELRQPLYDFMVEHEIRGTLLLALVSVSKISERKNLLTMKCLSIVPVSN